MLLSGRGIEGVEPNARIGIRGRDIGAGAVEPAFEEGETVRWRLGERPPFKEVCEWECEGTLGDGWEVSGPGDSGSRERFRPLYAGESAEGVRLEEWEEAW